jgi:hypothetical protein
MIARRKEVLPMKKTHILSGHAQLPAGTDIYENFKVVTIVVEVDIKSGEIVDGAVPTFCQQNSDFVVAMLRGKFLDRDLELIIAEIENRWQMLSKRALITALQGVHNRYIILTKPGDKTAQRKS